MSIANLNQGTLSTTSELPFRDVAASTDRRAPVSELIDVVSEAIGFVGDPAPTIISGPTYTLSASDERATLNCQYPLTIIVPEGLVLAYGVVVRCPPTGAVTVSPGSVDVLLNGGTADLTRDGTSSPTGFAITPTLVADSWGVSVAVVTPAAPSFGTLAGVPADNVALTAALALKADVASLPQTLLRTTGPHAGIATGSAQIFNAGGANPSQVILPAATLVTTSQRLSVKWCATDNGTTDPLAVQLYLGTLGTIADTLIGNTGSLAAGIRIADGEFVVQRIDATHVSCTLRGTGASTTAFAFGSVVVPNLDTTQLALSLAVKTGTTDIPTLVSCEMELR